MINRRSFCQSLGLMPSVLFTKSETSKRISVADFGVVPNMKDAGLAIQRMIAATKGLKNLIIDFPPGTYRFAATAGICMEFSGYENLTIYSEGAVLIFTGKVAPFLFKSCRQIAITGFVVDWEAPPYIQGTVIRSSSDLRSVTMKLDFELDTGSFISLGRICLYDTETGALKVGGVDTSHVIDNYTICDRNTLTLHLVTKLPLQIGSKLIIFPLDRGQHIFNAINCHGICIQRMTLYAGPAMGVTAVNCSDINIRALSVKRKSGTGRLISTNADAMHLMSCFGYIKISGCVLEGMGDDGINVTNRYLPVDMTKSSENVIYFEDTQDDLIIQSIEVGDTLKVVDKANLNVMQKVRVTQRTKNMVRVDQTVVIGASEKLELINESKTPHTLISDCHFGPNRARGVLAHSDAIIEKCSFSHQSGPAILLAPDLMWREGPEVSQVIIRDNVFFDTNTLNQGEGTIQIDAFVSTHRGEELPVSTPVNKNIMISRNVFKSARTPCIYCNATDWIIVKDNTFESGVESQIIIRSTTNLDLSAEDCTSRASNRLDYSTLFLSCK